MKKTASGLRQKVYKTGSFSNVNILYVGDPQVGASKGQPQGEGKLSADPGAANTAASNDGFGWDRTLDIALAENPDLNFVISAGDQVNKTGKPKEEEYAAYLSASALKKPLPVYYHQTGMTGPGLLLYMARVCLLF